MGRRRGSSVGFAVWGSIFIDERMLQGMAGKE
jgi:hypothetical protein